MTHVTVPRLKYWLAALIAFGAMTLAACQPTLCWVGLDAISPDGRWATVVERSGDPATMRLLRLDLETGETTLLAEDIADNPVSGFSPDGRYVVYRTRGDWWLRDLTAAEAITISEEVEALEFLPTGELLVTSRIDGLEQFETVSPADLQVPSLLAGRIRYRFSDQPPYQALLDDTRQLPCAHPPTTVRLQWVAIDAGGAVSVLTPTRPTEWERKLHPRLSDRVTEFFERQAVTVEYWVAEERKEWEREIIRAYAESQGDFSFSDEELALFDEQLEQYRASLVSLTLFGTMSPDGDRLLFLRVIPGGGDKQLYSLYLIDLTSDAEPQVLSSETEWVPGYAFSPDGDRLLFLHVIAGGGDKKLYSLDLIDLTTHRKPQFLSLSSETEWIPSYAFSPDGQQILFESNRDGVRALYLANADGGDIHPIVEQGALNPCWH